MKKLISITLMLALVLSLGISAFAQIIVDGEVKTGSTPDVYVHEGDAQWVSVDGNGVVLNVNGENGVRNNTDNIAVSASNNSQIFIINDVEDSSNHNAINAVEDALVYVEGSVSESDAGEAIYAKNSTVTVEGNVTENDDGNAITADGGTTVIVMGDVSENYDGNAIVAENSSVVKVGGDVKEDDDGNAIVAKDSTVIVEGKVDGVINQIGSANIYIGQLNGEIDDYSTLNNIHYLIGFVDDSLLNEIDFVDERDIIEHDKVSGVNKTYQFFTSTADATTFDGAIVILKPNDSGKELTVSDLPAGVTSDSDNGKLTLKFDSSFKGGLQNLMLVLKNIAHDNEDIYVVYVPDYLVSAAADFTLPEGLTEADVSLYNRDSHAGITLSASLLSGNVLDSVKVFRDSEELPSGNYSFLPHKDGSVSVILSNTYLLSLGNGSYNFTVAVDGLEIPVTVTVTIVK